MKNTSKKIFPCFIHYKKEGAPPEAHREGYARITALVLVGGFALFTLLSVHLGQLDGRPSLAKQRFRLARRVVSRASVAQEWFTMTILFKYTLPTFLVTFSDNVFAKRSFEVWHKTGLNSYTMGGAGTEELQEGSGIAVVLNTLRLPEYRYT